MYNGKTLLKKFSFISNDINRFERYFTLRFIMYKKTLKQIVGAFLITIMKTYFHI